MMYVVHDILHDFVSFYFTDENTQGNTTVTRYRLPNGETNSVRLLLLGTHFFNSKNDLISRSIGLYIVLDDCTDNRLRSLHTGSYNFKMIMKHSANCPILC